MQEQTAKQACIAHKSTRATVHKRHTSKQGKIISANVAGSGLFGCSRSAAARARAGKPTQRLEPSTKDADQLADVGQRRLEAVRKGRFSSSRTSGASAAPLSAFWFVCTSGFGLRRPFHPASDGRADGERVRMRRCQAMLPAQGRRKRGGQSTPRSRRPGRRSSRQPKRGPCQRPNAGLGSSVQTASGRAQSGPRPYPQGASSQRTADEIRIYLITRSNNACSPIKNKCTCPYFFLLRYPVVHDIIVSYYILYPIWQVTVGDIYSQISTDDIYISIASTNLLTQEMLTLQRIIFRRRNGLVWCRTLDIAMIGNLRRGHRGPPKYGKYLTTTRL